jgi:nucleotide-binding universal stress UspA family protein
MYRNILVPIDGSDTAKRGLHEAIMLAKGNGTTLRLVHIANTAVVALEYAETSAPTEDWSARRLAVGEAALKEAESIVKQNGLHSESVMLETTIDNTGELIVKQAVDWHADVIVMGTHGRRGLSRLVLGSNAEYVLRHAAIPVLLVRMQSKR